MGDELLRGRGGHVADLALAVAFVLPGSTAAAEPGPIVTAVELRADAPLARPESVLNSITVEVGRPLEREELSRSLLNLHASGLAGQIEAWTGETPGGVRVSFVLRARTLVDRVAIEGDSELPKRALRKVIELRAEEPLYADRIFRSVYRLQDLHAAEGYLDARARVRVDEHPDRRRATVVFSVNGGEPWTVGAVRFAGELGPYSGATLEERLRAGVGARFRRETIQADAERLEGWLREAMYLTARVGEPQEVPDENRRQVALEYPVEVGRRFEVEVQGADLEALRKKGLLPFLEGERFDEVMALRTRAKLGEHFQSRGHYDVEVDLGRTALNGAEKILVEIEPGPVATLSSVALEGNELVPDSRLLPLLDTAPRRALSLGGGRLVDEQLEDDLANLRSFYALEGFIGTEIGPPVVRREGGDLHLTIPIVEGRRRRVSDLRIEGGEALDPTAWLDELSLWAGGPYHPRRLEEALDQVRSRCEERGYGAAQLSASLDWNAAGDRVAVVLRLLEGPRNVVDRVILRGNRSTRAGVIHRAMDLEAGEPLNRQMLLEAQRGLYRLGVFSRVEVGLVPGTPYSSGRDVMVRVEEAAPWRVSYGVGYDSEDGVRALAGLSHANLAGRAISGRVDLRASEREQLARLLVRQPYLGRFEVPLTYSLFTIDEALESFASRRTGFQLGLERRRGDLRLGLLYTYKRVDLEETDEPLQPLEIDREFREVEISSLTPSVLVDRRNDAVSPSRGWSSSLSTEVAFPFLDAEDSFIKLFAQQTGYLPLGRLGYLAGSLRWGAIEPSGSNSVDPTLPLDLPSAQVKISERFFAGGRTTHRAYERDRLGIPGETLLTFDDPEGPSPQPVPVGGNGLLLANLDYRFPLFGDLGGSLFLDAGNVWADWRGIDLGEVKLGAGIGLRYRSPVGPVRLEVGWKIERELGESGSVILFSFGNPF